MDLIRYQRSMDLSTSTPTYNNYNLNNYDFNYTYEGADTSHTVNIQGLMYFLKELVFPFLISIIGLSFFIFILSKKEVRDNQTSWLVFNVLVAALIRGFIVLPVTIHTLYIAGTWTTGEAGCFIFTFLSNVNQIHIQISLLLLMVDRFIYFSKQSSYPDIMTPKKVRLAIMSSVACELVITIICTVVNVPQVIESHHTEYCIGSMSENGWIVQSTLSLILPTGISIIFGLITFVCTLVMCHKLNEGNSQERTNKKQAVALNILGGIFNLTCCLPVVVFTILLLTPAGNEYNQPDLWEIVINLNNIFYLVLPILAVVLIPEIRNEMACCKKDKKGEKTPLI